MKLNSSSENQTQIQNQKDNENQTQFQTRQSQPPFQKRRGPRYGTYNNNHSNQTYNNNNNNLNTSTDEDAQLQEKEKCLFVSFVNSSGVSHSQLSTFFSTFGKVKKVYIPKNQPNQAPRNFAFVTFETKEAAETVLDTCPPSGFRIEESVFFVAKNKKKTIIHSTSFTSSNESENLNGSVETTPSPPSIETTTTTNNSEVTTSTSIPSRKKSKSFCIQPLRQPLTGAPTVVGFSADYQKERKLGSVPTFPASASPGFAIPPKQEEKKETKKKTPPTKKQNSGQQNQSLNKETSQSPATNSRQESQAYNESDISLPAIHSAIIQKKEQEVFLLLLQGQNPNATDRQGQTALDLCNSILSNSPLAKEDSEAYKRILGMLTTYEAKTTQAATKPKVTGPPTNFNAPVFVPSQNNQPQEKEGDIMKFFSNLSLEKKQQFPQHRQASQVSPGDVSGAIHMKQSTPLFVPHQAGGSFVPYFQPQPQEYYNEGNAFTPYPSYSAYEQGYAYYDYSHTSSAPFIPQKQQQQMPAQHYPYGGNDSSFPYTAYLPSTAQGLTQQHYQQQQQQYSNYYYPNTPFQSVPNFTGAQSPHSSPQPFVKK